MKSLSFGERSSVRLRYKRLAFLKVSEFWVYGTEFKVVKCRLRLEFFSGNGNLPAIPPTSPSTPVSTTDSLESTKENANHENFTDKERQVQEILMEATRNGKQTNDQDQNNVINNSSVPGMIEDDNKNMVDDSVMKPLDVNQAVQAAPNAGAEISAS